MSRCALGMQSTFSVDVPRGDGFVFDEINIYSSYPASCQHLFEDLCSGSRTPLSAPPSAKLMDGYLLERCLRFDREGTTGYLMPCLPQAPFQLDSATTMDEAVCACLIWVRSRWSVYGSTADRNDRALPQAEAGLDAIVANRIRTFRIASTTNRHTCLLSKAMSGRDAIDQQGPTDSTLGR